MLRYDRGARAFARLHHWPLLNLGEVVDANVLHVHGLREQAGDKGNHPIDPRVAGVASETLVSSITDGTALNPQGYAASSGHRGVRFPRNVYNQRWEVVVQLQNVAKSPLESEFYKCRLFHRPRRRSATNAGCLRGQEAPYASRRYDPASNRDPRPDSQERLSQGLLHAPKNPRVRRGREPREYCARWQPHPAFPEIRNRFPT